MVSCPKSSQRILDSGKLTLLSEININTKT
jgi:hypothetical protein